MTVSSRNSDWNRAVVSEWTTVAQQRPQHINQTTGQRQQSMGMKLLFAALSVVEPTRWPVLVAQTRQGSHEEHPAQAPVVAFRPVQIARHPARIARDRHQAGVGGQTARAGESRQITASIDEELSTQSGAHPGQRFDDVRPRVFPETRGDELVGVLDLAIEI